MKKDYCEKFADDGYGKSALNLLAQGFYKGFEFKVLNICGDHPCGYVRITSKRRFLEDSQSEWLYERFGWVKCHWGITYARPYLYVNDKRISGFWIGWDYSHYGDYSYKEARLFGSSRGDKHSTDEVVNDCREVIDQICERLENIKSYKENEVISSRANSSPRRRRY